MYVYVRVKYLAKQLCLSQIYNAFIKIYFAKCNLKNEQQQKFVFCLTFTFLIPSPTPSTSVAKLESVRF